MTMRYEAATPVGYQPIERRDPSVRVPEQEVFDDLKTILTNELENACRRF